MTLTPADEAQPALNAVKPSAIGGAEAGTASVARPVLAGRRRGGRRSCSTAPADELKPACGKSLAGRASRGFQTAGLEVGCRLGITATPHLAIAEAL